MKIACVSWLRASKATPRPSRLSPPRGVPMRAPLRVIPRCNGEGLFRRSTVTRKSIFTFSLLNSHTGSEGVFFSGSETFSPLRPPRARTFGAGPRRAKHGTGPLGFSLGRARSGSPARRSLLSHRRARRHTSPGALDAHAPTRLARLARRRSVISMARKRGRNKGSGGEGGGARPGKGGPGENWGKEEMRQAASPLIASHPSGALVAVAFGATVRVYHLALDRLVALASDLDADAAIVSATDQPPGADASAPAPAADPRGSPRVALGRHPRDPFRPHRSIHAHRGRRQARARLARPPRPPRRPRGPMRPPRPPPQEALRRRASPTTANTPSSPTNSATSTPSPPPHRPPRTLPPPGSNPTANDDDAAPEDTAAPGRHVSPRPLLLHHHRRVRAPRRQPRVHVRPRP